jgi:CPA1 family monovalent cation:H+ antiporter
MNDIPVDVISCIVALLLLAGLSAIVLKKLHFPYTIGLVVIGMVLGVAANRYDWLGPLGNIHLTPNIILYILLPTLVFEAAVNIDTRLLFKNIAPVLTLAAPGLIIATVITGTLIAWLTPLTLGPAMLFGGLISATDPVAVIAVFKDLGAPKRLTMLVDGESLFNDATAIVMFDIVLGMLVGGVAFSAVTVINAGIQFVLVFAGGAVVGALIGYIMVQVLSLARDNPVIEIAFTTVVAYAAFIVAQFYLELSGVMAVVGAGLVVSYYGNTRFNPVVKGYISQFWEFASFAANSYIFLLLGLTENYLTRGAHHLLAIGGYTLIAVVVVQVARVAVVFGLVPVANKLKPGHPIGRRYQAVMFWGGLRGALPIGLAMSLTAAQVGGEQNRLIILDLTLGIVLFTLLVQGTTVSRLMHWLGLGKLTKLDRREITETSLIARREAVNKVNQVEKEWPVLNENVLEQIRKCLEEEVRHLQQEAKQLVITDGAARDVLWIQAFSVVERTIRSMYDLGFMHESVLREVEHVLELGREDIRHGIIPPRGLHRRPVPEERVNNLMTFIVSRIAPNSRYLRRLYAHKVELEYSVDLAITEADKILQNSLPHIEELSQVGSADVEECRAFFSTLKDEALSRIGLLRERFFEELESLQERTISRFALLAEERVLDEISANQAISARAEAVIRQDIDQRKGRIGKRADFAEPMP